MGELSAAPGSPGEMDIDPVSSSPAPCPSGGREPSSHWHISPLTWEKIWRPTLAGLPRAALDNLFK